LGILFGATFLLGVGFYSYLAAAVMMPIYLVLTFGVLLHMGKKSLHTYAVAVAGFLLPLLPLVPWHIAHPEQRAAQIRMYNIYDASR
ncbi:hypothetical protein ACH0C8_16380, partial [Acetobacter lovaniensis]|uniref:hypothetical protein n=1 Tax=Acetobacter lovaniensis TaxID=104100 RepID=UPI00376FA260